MKIAYITTDTPYDKNSWSGTNYYVKKALTDQNQEVYCIFKYKCFAITIILKKILAKILRKKYQAIRSRQSAKGWARYILSHIESNTDAILSLSTIPVSFLNTKIPIYIYIDGIYEYMLGQGFNKMINNDQEAHFIEESALKRCTAIITSSVASANAITEHYDIPSSKIKIVPLGANIDNLPTEEEVMDNIITKKMDRCKILFVGVDWIRKGADIVINTAKLLYESGFPVEVHLVGIRNVPVSLPSYIINYGFISKMDKDGLDRLATLYKNAHFLFVPSLGEAYGLVFSEASAYGLPSISHCVGGIPTIVENGVNGELFEIGTKPEIFADYIQSMFKNEIEYKKLAKASYFRFKEKLSWEASGKKIIEIMEGR